MTAKEHLFYGLGIIAHVVARADGIIQADEKNELRELVEEWVSQLDVDYDITQIIFRVIDNRPTDNEEAYNLGMKYIRLGDQHLTESMKEKFVFLIRDVAHAFPPVTEEEKAMIDRFRSDLEKLK